MLRDGVAGPRPESRFRQPWRVETRKPARVAGGCRDPGAARCGSGAQPQNSPWRRLDRVDISALCVSSNLRAMSADGQPVPGAPWTQPTGSDVRQQRQPVLMGPFSVQRRFPGNSE
ncbi:hypothetical protein GN956_G20559 [Arapaima gigas]